MRSALLSPKEYRDFARQCLRWAAQTKSEEHKNMMLQMADHWMQTAQELERAGTGARLTSMPLPQTTFGEGQSRRRTDRERASKQH
jgi:hypothetical protein